MMNKNDIFERCLLSSIAHAVMTNIYPDLDYEQSWDFNNFSILIDNERCTISFSDAFCVGVVRNYNLKQFHGKYVEKILMNDFPKDVIKFAKDEALLYLLEDIAGEAVCCASGAFWSDENALYLSNGFKSEILSLIFSDKDTLFNHLVSYYNIDSKSKELVLELLNLKNSNMFKRIILTNEQISMIPGQKIVRECIQSLSEIGIFIGENLD